jgi:hypothetical protein
MSEIGRLGGKAHGRKEKETIDTTIKESDQ